jgi:hypothetical protein
MTVEFILSNKTNIVCWNCRTIHVKSGQFNTILSNLDDSSLILSKKKDFLGRLEVLMKFTMQCNSCLKNTNSATMFVGETREIHKCFLCNSSAKIELYNEWYIGCQACKKISFISCNCVLHICSYKCGIFGGESDRIKHFEGHSEMYLECKCSNKFCEKRIKGKFIGYSI